MGRMAQDFAKRYQLGSGQGNFGSIDGDGAAAMRYTEARMAPMGNDMLIDIGPGKSLGYRIEAMRLTGYQRLRELRDRLRHRPALPSKAGKAA
jgi:hypothetical protein